MSDMSCPCDDYSPEYCLIHNPMPPKNERPARKRRMSSGDTFTRTYAVEAVRRALCFWASLGYDVVDPDGVS